MRLDWIVDEHSENVSLPERPWRDLDNQTLREVKQRSETPGERPKLAFGLGELGASPFGSRMPKETRTSKEPTDYACVLILCVLPWVSLTLLELELELELILSQMAQKSMLRG